jgi:hypothetical protein
MYSHRVPASMELCRGDSQPDGDLRNSRLAGRSDRMFFKTLRALAFARTTAASLEVFREQFEDDMS